MGNIYYFEKFLGSATYKEAWRLSVAVEGGSNISSHWVPESQCNWNSAAAATPPIGCLRANAIQSLPQQQLHSSACLRANAIQIRYGEKRA